MMNYKSTNNRFLLTTILMLFTLMLAIPGVSSAASSCKGKSKTSCSSDGRCSWVNSYKTKKGNKVSAFCRAKPGKSSSKTYAKSDKAAKNTKAKKSANKKAGTSKKGNGSKKAAGKKSKENKKSKESKKSKNKKSKSKGKSNK